MTTRRDWDILLTQGSTTHKLRLLNTDGKKAWQVSEAPPTPQIGDAAASRSGFSPDRSLPFTMEDWSWGVGLDRFGTSANERGHIFRYADGFGIDTSEPGFVKHGPLVDTSYGAVAAGEVIGQFILFADKVYLRTTNMLYNIQSGTLTLLKDFGAEVLTDLAVFNDKLYIAVDTADTYYYWEDGGSETSVTVTGGATHFLSTQGKTEPILIRSYSTNFISSAIDPTDATSWDITSKAMGDGDAITNLFVISGFAFAGTQSTVFLLASDNDGVTIPIELDKRLSARRSTDAFSIKAESGSDVWLSDGGNIIRITAAGFESFEVSPDGPFRSYDDRPFNADIKGTVKSMTQDIDAVFVCVDRSGEIYVYKGIHLSRGTHSWTPIAKFTGTNAACGVFKTTSDTSPKLYVGNTLEVESYVTEDWTTYTTSWELITAQFTATLETWDKMWFAISAFLKLSGATAKVEVAYKLDNDAAWTDFDATGPTNDMAADEYNELKLITTLNGKKIRLKFSGTSGSSAHFVHMRSFNLDGVLRPPRKPIFDFKVVADTNTECTFINALRTDNTQLFTITDRFDVARTAFMLPGFPVEEELFDEARKEPVRTYRVVAQEVA